MRAMLFAMASDRDLKIRKYPDDNLGDNPDIHRWRAFWDRDSADAQVLGIQLRCFPVTKLTPSGAWIDPDAWLLGGDGLKFSMSHSRARWVSNDGGAAWAKRTQADALTSLVFRYCRWAQRIVNDAEYFIQASRALRILMPDRADAADAGLRKLNQFITAEAA